MGSINNTFGIKGVGEHTIFFKSIEDANRLRRQVSECFERAALPHSSVKVIRPPFWCEQQQTVNTVYTVYLGACSMSLGSSGSVTCHLKARGPLLPEVSTCKLNTNMRCIGELSVSH